jgi:hypothetical protein
MLTCYHCGKTNKSVTFTRTERPDFFSAKSWNCTNLPSAKFSYHPVCYQKAEAIAEKFLFPKAA